MLTLLGRSHIMYPDRDAMRLSTFNPFPVGAPDIHVFHSAMPSRKPVNHRPRTIRHLEIKLSNQSAQTRS